MIAGLRRLPALETALLVAATLVLIVAGVLRERDRSSGATPGSFSSYDAAGGGYRAFYELLEREGVRVDRFVRRPAFLDASLATLVWAEPAASDARQARTTPADVAALEAWVRAGGRLLYIGHDDRAARQGVLHLPQSRSTSADDGARGRFGVADSLRAAGVALLHSPETLRWVPRKEHRALVYDRAGALVLAYPFGRGSVVAVIDEQLFANANIARAANARLAYALARPLSRNGRVAFDETVHGYGVPEHWWSIVPPLLGAALALGGLALSIGLAGAAMRLGPPLVPASRTDRSGAEFIDAAAALLERGAASATALHDAAHSTSRALGRSLGCSDESSDAEIAERLPSAAARADFDRMLAAARQAAPSETDLVRGVASAQRLRKDAAHGRPRY